MDFQGLSEGEKLNLTQEIKILETQHFPFKKKIKKLKGLRGNFYRLRVDLKTQSFRVFYSILDSRQIILLRIVSKKEADRVINALR